jgi:hypothetical protein
MWLNLSGPFVSVAGAEFASALFGAIEASARGPTCEQLRLKNFIKDRLTLSLFAVVYAATLRFLELSTCR